MSLLGSSLCASHDNDAQTLLRGFLQQKPTANAAHLSKKAVVGLIPEVLFGRIIWG
jgi:hypothetical protein